MNKQIELARLGFPLMLAFAVTEAQAVCNLPPVTSPPREVNPSGPTPGTFQIKHFRNDNGLLGAISGDGYDNPFFQDIGTNERTCSTCHLFKAGGGLDVGTVQAQFTRRQTNDPLFRANDGSWSTDLGNRAASGEIDACTAYGNLLKFGDIKIARPLPQGANFTIEVVHEGATDPDPITGQTYHFAQEGDNFLFYRRPLATNNLDVGLSGKNVMWDSRETQAFKTDALKQQFKDATTGHAQADITPNDAEAANAVAYELGLFFAQYQVKGSSSGPATWTDDAAKGAPKSAPPAQGGPDNIMTANANGGTKVFDLFDAWQDSSNPKQKMIFEGQELFNTKGCAAFCHTGHNTGNNKNDRTFNIGVSADVIVAAGAPQDANATPADMKTKLPLYRLTSTVGEQPCPANAPLSGQREWVTTDPGLALTTGKWCDIDKFKTPQLRGLQRGHFFHNGSAATLKDVVLAYKKRFTSGGINFSTLTDQEVDKLVAFLNAL